MDALSYLHEFLSPADKLRVHSANQDFPFPVPEHKDVAIAAAALSKTSIADICFKMTDPDEFVVLNKNLALFQNELCVANWCHKHREIIFYTMSSSGDRFWIKGDSIAYYTRQCEKPRRYKGSKVDHVWYLISNRDCWYVLHDGIHEFHGDVTEQMEKGASWSPSGCTNCNDWKSMFWSRSFVDPYEQNSRLFIRPDFSRSQINGFEHYIDEFAGISPLSIGFLPLPEIGDVDD